MTISPFQAVHNDVGTIGKKDLCEVDRINGKKFS